MLILSLFDGIACGRLALERAGIKVDAYYASEIDETAIKIAKHNFPDIIEIGSVTDIKYDKSKGILHTANGDFNVGTIDLLIGGSPCTDFSYIGKCNGIKFQDFSITMLEQYLYLKEKGVEFQGHSYLFWEYARILKETQPQYFLFENVVMPINYQKIIDNALNVTPIKINSALLSAQNRPRLYWTNIENVSVPTNKEINLRDILDENAPKDDVSYCETVKKCMPKINYRYGYMPSKFNAYNCRRIENKASTLTMGSMVSSSCATLLFVKAENGKYIVKNNLLNGKYATLLRDGCYNIRKLSVKEAERLQTLPDNYTAVQGIGEAKRSKAIGNGWTVNVIAHIFKYLK